MPAVVCAMLVALGAAATCARAATPRTQRCRAVALKLTFTLPSDWACIRSTANGVRFAGQAPSRVGLLEVYSAGTPPGGSLVTYAEQLVGVVRRDFTGKGAHLKIASTSTRIASVPALLFTVHYDGRWLEGAGQEGEIVHLIYFFHRKGVLYEFDYSSVTPWATKYVPAFDASAKSVRFVSSR